MSINSEIRKIAKAWGVDTKGSSIKDALKDLRTNLPFGTKTEMVEIVPEITKMYSNTAEGFYVGYVEYKETKAEQIGRNFPDKQLIIEGNRYKVIFNGEEYVLTAKYDEQYEGAILGDYEFTGTSEEDMTLIIKGAPFVVFPGSSISKYLQIYAPMQITRDLQLPEFNITIYEEQEVATPLDIKYLPIDELKQALGIGGDA